MEGGILTHKRADRDWRLRRFRDKDDNHPIDPNWETGSYIACHEDARATIRPGVMIFDIVYVDGRGVIRSAFQVRDAHGDVANRVLHFDRFWYPGPQAKLVTALNAIRSTRYPEGRTAEQVESLINQLRSSGYIEYETGQIPSALNSSDWNAMVEAGRRALGRRHSCA